MSKVIFYAIICSLVFFFSSCVGFRAYWNLDTDLIETSYKNADQLIGRTLPPLIPDQNILIASYVNIDNLEESSTFGRAISEYIASRFVQRGYKVVEMKLRKSAFIRKKGGEFMLSRALKDISTEHNVQAVIVGTYSIASDLVYVSSRIINPADNIVISTYDYLLPLGSNTLKMLENTDDPLYW